MTTYLGAFRLPAADGPDPFSFAGLIAVDRASGRLSMGTRDGQVAALIRPPELVNGPLNTLPIAALEATWTVAESFPTGAALSGFLVDNGVIAPVTASMFYDANNTQRVGHYVHNAWRTVLDDHRQGFVAGYMCWVPERWRAELGDILTGQACINIITRTSHGPAAFGVRLADFDTPGVVPARELLYYDHAHQTLGEYRSALIAGCAIIGDELIFAGRFGTGPFCYGIGTRNADEHDQILAGERRCYDLESNDKGGHSYPYRYQLWKYQIADLLAATNPWDCIPIIEPLPALLPGVTRLIGCASHGDTLYLSQYNAENTPRVGGYPVVHAFQMTPEVIEPPPVEPPIVVPLTLEQRVARLERTLEIIGTACLEEIG
jgi:hypothetical protein